MQLSEARCAELSKLIPSVFRPGTAITNEDIFAGRREQLMYIQDTVACPGMHAVIFGERGVGKTSLAELCAGIYRSNGRLAATVTCSPSDDFQRIWENALNEFRIVAERLPVKMRVDVADAIQKAKDELGAGDVDPFRVRFALLHITKVAPIIIFFDEFDKLEDRECLSLFSNTIKQLSDKAENIVLVPVGVGESIKTLIAEHQSIERCLNQIRMPRMGHDAIEGIITSGFNALGMTIDQHSKDLIHFVSRGLPQYTHLLAMEAARRAAMTHARDSVSIADVEAGLSTGMAKLEHSLTEDYERATNTANRSNHADVLYACSIVSFGDWDGYFTPGAIREYYSKITKKPRTISHFNPNLVNLCRGRGNILERKGSQRSWKYRFRNSVMGPFVLMKGILADRIDPKWYNPPEEDLSDADQNA